MYSSYSHAFYSAIVNFNNLFRLALLFLFIGFLFYQINKYFKNKKFWNSITSVLITSVLAVSFFIGYQIENLNIIGFKIINKINLERNIGQNIPLNLNNLDTNYFNNNEIEIINSNFVYQYNNKDSLNKRASLKLQNDYYDLGYQYRFMIFKTNLYYNFNNNKFYYAD
jgi:predicted PurR-regulated permease PerM